MYWILWFPNNCFTKKFSSLRSHMRKVTRKPEEIVWHKICFNKRLFSLTKNIFESQKSKRMQQLSVFLLVVASWSRTYFELFSHYDKFHKTMRLNKASFRNSIFRSIMPIWGSQNDETVRNIMLNILSNRLEKMEYLWIFFWRVT